MGNRLNSIMKMTIVRQASGLLLFGTTGQDLFQK